MDQSGPSTVSKLDITIALSSQASTSARIDTERSLTCVLSFHWHSWETKKANQVMLFLG